MSAQEPFDHEAYLRNHFRHAISCARNKARITSRTQIVDVLAAFHCGVVTAIEMAAYLDANLDYASTGALEWAARSTPAAILEEVRKRNPDFKP